MSAAFQVTANPFCFVQSYALASISRSLPLVGEGVPRLPVQFRSPSRAGWQRVRVRVESPLFLLSGGEGAGSRELNSVLNDAPQGRGSSAAARARPGGHDANDRPPHIRVFRLPAEPRAVRYRDGRRRGVRTSEIAPARSDASPRIPAGAGSCRAGTPSARSRYRDRNPLAPPGGTRWRSGSRSAATRYRDGARECPRRWGRLAPERARSSIGSRSAGSFWPSPSMVAIQVPRAAVMPVTKAAVLAQRLS